MAQKSSSSLGDSLKSTFAAIVIPLEVVLAILIYLFILGDPSNFEGGDPNNHPLHGNYLGVVYKGGIVVAVLIALLMIVLTFSIERLITISSATGRGSIKKFVTKIRTLIAQNNISQAIAECDRQKGSVANVVKAGLLKYDELSRNTELEPEKKVLLVQKDIEETTQLEMPMLERNLVIIATIASVATLMGLLGTVTGMIRAFTAIATSGAPDAVALANGISEALINTALGIGTSALAIIFYNFFTSKIDSLTYGIDEASYSIIQNFTARNKA
ncbi:MotA/TolQ/ExbB proton channel family protein [Fulvivirgaceae bacterium PWU4]|uniref:MotA/TolQ/ExbB proton channel family protein n=1 Tax=Chryseosolibacter histidini TaxID=2782349 RepID=A0AAP2GK11_9BACT|nr:MotA/TolQ/ExbB proton channel family protein [Chryseosolibacter histidini]MBT1698559.1 MotA/TolQ/ExbB proton channel family protein [Chryseosolibacter histidini]